MWDKNSGICFIKTLVTGVGPISNQEKMNIETIIEVFNGNKHTSYTYKPSIYGEYKMKGYTINDRPYFKMSNFRQNLGIWWTGKSWKIGNHSDR